MTCPVRAGRLDDSPGSPAVAQEDLKSCRRSFAVLAPFAIAFSALVASCPDPVPPDPYLEDDYLAPEFAVPDKPDFEIRDWTDAYWYFGLEFADGKLWVLRNATTTPYDAVLMRADATSGVWEADFDLKAATGHLSVAYDLAFDATRVFVLYAGRIYVLAKSDMSVKGYVTTGLTMQGIAVIGSTAYVTGWQGADPHRVWKFELPPEGTTGAVALAPESVAVFPAKAYLRGLTAMGGRLYAADSFDDTVVAIDPGTGAVVHEFLQFEREETGIGSDGECLYMRDKGTADVRPLWFQRLDDRVTRSEPLEVRVVFRATVRNVGAGNAAVRVRAALPRSDARQDMRSLDYPGAPAAGTDRYGWRYAVLSTGTVPPGGEKVVEWTADARVWALKVRLPDDASYDASSSPKAVKDHFLSDTFSYLAMKSATVADFAASIPGSPSRLMTFARATRDKVFSRLEYDLDGAWDDAATVLNRGSGSCSEYSFVTSAALRLRGWPTRFVGATTGIKPLSQGIADTVHHRWIEIYAPGIGWMPMDCNANDSGAVGPWSDEFVFGVDSRKLVILKGGCEDGDWLGRGYTWNYVVDSGIVSVSAGYWWSLR